MTPALRPKLALRSLIATFAGLTLTLGWSIATLHLSAQSQDGDVASDPMAVDHAGFVRGWDAAALTRGESLYNSVCITCHGNLTQPGTLPTSRAFWKEPFKNGHDPLSLYKTLSTGFGQMPAWTFLTPQQRYDVIHYLRETFLKPHNPKTYFAVTPDYLKGLPSSEGRVFTKTPEMIAFEKGPRYLQMDFGPALFWTFQVSPNNIAQKGIAIRLDDGPGGISKGKAWMLYDHDTLRAATAWTGSQFVDWKGIAFDGSHGTHTSIVGQKTFENPVGPGWAHPDTGRFDDPRPLGRDGKPYGPLPRSWVHYKGLHRNGSKLVLAYTVGQTEVLEQPGLVPALGPGAFSRAFNIGASQRDLLLRIAPTGRLVGVLNTHSLKPESLNGFEVLRIPAALTPIRLTVIIDAPAQSRGPFDLANHLKNAPPTPDLTQHTRGGPPLWNPPVATQGKIGKADGAFAVDELVPPADTRTPGRSWMRFGGLDFFPGGKHAAVATWNGDVWIVSGIDGDLSQLVWQRVATGLFQPLGVKIVDHIIHVACRDQIARLHDRNGDGEIDYIENFNNDHQVTEHFHEFAMGLQTDRDGSFYYAKSARHALPAVVPHHGTLLKVSKDGSKTEIVANGFRAANGVCVNDDGTFFVTDQEGHWTPKNRINSIHPGGFYGNMFGYHNRTSSADADMEQPLVWITNDMDRSPGELVRVTSDSWGPLKGALLNLSYGTGRIFIVPHEKIDGQMQGGVTQLPIPDLPTGVMRGRFHPDNGALYACGMFAWAGNRTSDGGFYRIRPTGKPAWLPTRLHARPSGVDIEFSDPIDPASARDLANYSVKVWGLKRSASYGSQHLNEHGLKITSASLAPDGRTVSLEIPDLAPTWGMEIRCALTGKDGTPFHRTVHNTIHKTASTTATPAQPKSSTPPKPQAAIPATRLNLPGENFTLRGRPAFVLLPDPAKRSTPQPWVFYAPTLPCCPDEAERWMHEQFLKAGVAVAGIDVGEAYGSPKSHEFFDALYSELTQRRGFARKACLFGRSRGGLWASSWAIANPDRVAGLIGIYPVYDLRSYPGLATAAPAYGLTPTELEQRLAEFNPVARLSTLARAKIPVTIIHGDVDKTVPLPENSGALLRQYEAEGVGNLVRLIVLKGQGHNFYEGFFHSQEVVDFAIQTAQETARVERGNKSPTP